MTKRVRAWGLGVGPMAFLLTQGCVVLSTGTLPRNSSVELRAAYEEADAVVLHGSTGYTEQEAMLPDRVFSF